MSLRFLQIQEEGSAHILRLVRNNGSGVSGNFQIRKAQGNQTLEIRFPDGVTLEEIQQAWTDAGSKWDQHYLKEREGIFEAMRYIFLTNGQTVSWYVYHCESVPPADALRVWSRAWNGEEIGRFYGFEDSHSCETVNTP